LSLARNPLEEITRKIGKRSGLKPKKAKLIQFQQTSGSNIIVPSSRLKRITSKWISQLTRLKGSGFTVNLEWANHSKPEKITQMLIQSRLTNGGMVIKDKSMSS